MTTTQMILRTGKLRRGDTVIQQVPDEQNPYREVVLTEPPVIAELPYRGSDVPVRYFTGYDPRARHVVMLTGTEHQVWQILREG